MNTPLISVLMPVYNGEQFLSEAIESILNQTYQYFEFIILNDGSTDSTEEIIHSYKDSRIRYIKNEKNLKLIKTLNKGIELAKGEYIARMDADDISLPTRFQEQLDLFLKETSLSIVSCFPLNINEDGKILSKSSYFCTTLSESCHFVSMFEAPILHPGSMIRTSALIKYKYLDNKENIHVEAYNLWYRMLRDREKCKIIPKFLMQYRNNEQGVCNSYSELQHENGRSLSAKIIKTEVGIELPPNVHLTIIKRGEFEDPILISSSLKHLDKLMYLYFDRNNLSSVAKKEVIKWCKQRKIAIILNSLLHGNKRVRKTCSYLLLSNISLLFNWQNIQYIKNRLTRIINSNIN